ncbi:hypothetical protein D0T66_14150 [Dysgonomonas sp. 25]|nr:hypothetical protein [Dysgonomonas sp. 25]
MNIEQYNQLIESCLALSQETQEKQNRKTRNVIIKRLIEISEIILKSHDKELIQILSNYHFDNYIYIYIYIYIYQDLL